ncbi:MAG: flagellar filament protein FlaA [Treponema sp.]|nr:flagellar filament protein FlaA [Treponema sp.]
MKKGVVVFINVVLLLLLCMPAFSQTAQQTQRSVETFIVDKFDGGSEWSWEVAASRYIADGYPKQGFFEGIPSSLKYLRGKEESDPQVLGVQVAFNRKGDNWFEIYPVKDGEPYEIPFIGTVRQIDFWVWGANYLYYLDIMVRDAEGRVHMFPVCNMLFDGWRNVAVNIPGWIRQHSRLSTGSDSMYFLGFRIRTNPDEYVDQFTVFFDQMKYTTDSLAYIFDGYELKGAEFEDGGGSSSSNSSSRASEGK